VTHAFDMSRFQRVIATSETRIRGSFVVHSSEGHGIFAVDPFDLTIYSEDGSWGRGIKYGDFEIELDEGVPTLGEIRNESKRADIEAAREPINETLAVVVAAYLADDGKASSQESEAAS
jgi:hypothetical protein